ncbi:Orotate phosphoribosyltransferase [Pandoravirus salinus]|uniref:orotate phosphoribosyltransferase n=1 Tax=Pandoravirus salinus TaxID=1349410 RepID=S4W4D9_9VIRU|nr:Orotate phosphoribosyltransferase [Pandoravirus salinus]AGO85572.1 Orotate phosphoribosyltransferase [Pandoravirus salinus]
MTDISATPPATAPTPEAPPTTTTTQDKRVVLRWGTADATSRRTMADTLADHLVRTGAVQLRPRDFFAFPKFTTPAYCDLRLALGDVGARHAIAEALAAAIRTRFLAGGAETDATVITIVGVATGGIAYATGVADRLGLPLAYVRAAPKDHGKGKRVEGGLPVGGRCVVVDDVLGTGAAALDAVRALKDYGATVLGVCAIFSYDFDTLLDNVGAAEVPFVRLVDFAATIDRAQASGAIDPVGGDIVRAWYSHRSTWRSA